MVCFIYPLTLWVKLESFAFFQKWVKHYVSEKRCALSKYFTYIPLHESVYQGCELHIVAMAAFTVVLKSLICSRNILLSLLCSCRVWLIGKQSAGPKGMQGLQGFHLIPQVYDVSYRYKCLGLLSDKIYISHFL